MSILAEKVTLESILDYCVGYELNNNVNSEDYNNLKKIIIKRLEEAESRIRSKEERSEKMKISEKLQSQLEELCEIQSEKIEKLKSGLASQVDIEILSLTSELIESTVHSYKEIKRGD